jgi:uncharacterized delta-60 repeat protein
MQHDFSSRSPLPPPQPLLQTYTRNSLRNTWVLVCLLVLSLYALAVHAQTADDGFNPGTNGSVITSFIQSDGKIVVGGSFTGIGNHAIKRVARVNVDGSVDLTFNLGSGANGNVQVVAPVNSSSNSCGAYVGGDFMQYNGVPARMVVRFGCNGKIDSTFSLPAAAIGGVFAITTQPDGRIFIGGQFDNLDGGTPSANLARLNVTGSRDTSFSVAVNGPVRSIVVQPDGKILIGGSFTSVNGQARTLFARLNFDGSLDTSYNVAISGVGGNGVVFIQDVALQPDGKAIIAGRFTQINGVIRDSIARINTNGSLDASFAAITISAGFISAVKLQPDGKVLIGGAFGFVNGNAQQGMARLKQDGRLDGHGLRINDSVSTISVQADGGIILGGQFTSVGGASRNSLARVTRDLILDQSFDMPPPIGALSGFVSAIAVGARGEVVIGGGSTFANTIFNFAQLVLADGGFDGSFSGNFHLNSSVSAIAIQSDGKVLLGGEFTRRIERAIPHGGIDPTFNPGGVGADGTIKAIVIQPDGKILIAGSFTQYNGTSASNIARLDANGGLDRTFNANFIHPDFFIVNAFALQPDGKIIIGGQGILLRLTDKGDVDQSFASGAVPSTDTINVISYSKNNGAPQIFVGGTFSQMRGVPTKNVAKLTDSGAAVPAFLANTDGSVFSIVQQQGRGLIIGGSFTQVNGVARARLALLGPFFGEVEADYASTSVENGAVLALALQPDGKLLIGGSFTSVNGVARSRLARLSAVHSMQPSMRIGGLFGKKFVQLDTGAVSGAGYAEISVVQFDISTDATNWTNLGSAEGNGAGATLDNLKNLPKGRLFYIRARARVPSGQGNGSSSPYEQIKQFFIPSTDARDLDGDAKSDLIFRNGSTGQLTGWIMDGLDTLSAVGLVPPGAWTVSHTADFNGDGRADILFRNDDGSATLWLMDGLTVTATKGLLGPNPDWRATHVGDFDGDGKADILWRNTNGAVTLWLMDGTTIKSAVGLLGPNPDWSVSHVGDFNGDTATDILWRNTNGAVTMWLSVNPDQNIFNSAGLLGPNPDWSVSHVGDFNGDGKTDILWRNINGAVTMWLMNGTTQIAAAGMLGPNPDWRVSHVADFNGDGNADLLWRNNNGAVTQWLMDGVGAFTITGLLGADPNWRVTHTGDYNGDGKADLLWGNLDGSITMWQMDGSVIKQAGGLLGPSPWFVVPAQ